MSGPSIMETLFQRTLEDLIKGIRLQLIGESAFISKAMEEIRKEIKSTDLQTKSIALQKLSYLSPLHFVDMSWAAFHCIECMSSPRFAQKRIGYVAVSQSFNEHTPVLLLITNQLRKDLGSVNEFDAGLALDCLANIATVDLARDLTPEVFTLLGSSKVSVRKKAIGVILRVFEKYPDAVRVCFKRLVENLDSPDSRILSAAVGVFCELASRDPRSYLPLAPEFYRVLVDSKNNWVLIKVLKIFAKLAPLESRLAKRVVEPICDHMRRTGAKSLMFECIRTVVSSLSEYESALKLAVLKIRELLMDEDPNLKYLGLHALSIVAPKHLWVVLENKEVVIKSLSDSDSNIKFESLRLVMAVVSESNVVEISRVLLNYALKSDPEFCNVILGSILSACSRNVYEMVMDFDWYVLLLGEMSRIPQCQKGEDIENQLIDIGMRVRDARPELIRMARSLLIDPALLGNPFLYRILCAAAWVCGEYVEYSTNPFELVEALLQPRTSLLPPLIRAVYLQSVLKVLTFCIHSYLRNKSSGLFPFTDNLEGVVSESMSKGKTQEASDLPTPAQDDVFNPRISDDNPYEDLPLENNGEDSKFDSFEKNGFTRESIVNLLNLIELAVKPLLGSLEVEILERAQNVLGLIELIRQEFPDQLSPRKEILAKEESEVSKLIRSMNDAFCEELGPVSVTAQDRVRVPEGLVLEENLKELDTICGDIQPSTSSFFAPRYGERIEESLASDLQNGEDSEPSRESTSLLIEHRKRHGLYYLPSSASNDYPLANDLRSGENDRDETEDFVRLTAQSLAPKKKPNYSKPRPVVVKLDEGEVTLSVASKKPSSKYDLLSGVIQDVLQETNLMDKSSRKGKEKVSSDVPQGSKENVQDPEDPRREKSGLRKSKHRSHGKERKHKDPDQVDGKKDGKSERAREKSSHRHGRKKTRQRAEGPLNVSAQTPVIPDFLL
ncbi:AP-3 complex subunit delta [Punica granatum]|uniref:AP-3 complex subunit delta n=2 Tax=Punica granatum TaxID=22663 RepID=A0A218XEV2_PUNGR|nr:AP-3 complex subunit delta [Punica granatum]OWM83011.1 hypothetical protein CDL15_Pgr005411 [Punica granatum]PKI48327.1 hypothetical protein CRG98_031275 [Punica granatum]